MLFSIVLLLHFGCFAGYLAVLATQWSDYHTKVRDHKGLILGIALLVTGIILVALKYPHVNYYKVIPKTGIFAVVTLINIRFTNKTFTKAAYYALLALTMAAACIAIWH
ncbi:hypothetical protein SAMN05660461_2438 [Chitinophaga ginsengisegetis]|uniref:Uncharacterized protein n=1 Tax=Chitinophaga ginsengisegetis TaxID=393003 RepID=A0A1T5NNW3_9BACT|nr:hypothetical protein [Chitinophaga ginsengisegetis]MDR6565614.1 hypothetical protein [Chitinophaga ginsengisegetis]MDR6645343.1 hypothetical protein [Chitinophaga ginsengisegetis]MDR6652066.1 hypothetical protein [Chitinophaga ginsengisegetis]SKD02171.1 hypothetical protein SAMN05660461_2438 [Chitinophaga ginsengisegetis]